MNTESEQDEKGSFLDFEPSYVLRMHPLNARDISLEAVPHLLIMFTH